ncbi:MAG: CDF family Co(II)/Ni(II) efflux transporter DmeF [Halothece sp. Uz-M2-17]|nr:CDF family Co(II)/Ni(II) efflux transporter DmeF [Halothece sp. Uz-M2-17]
MHIHTLENWQHFHHFLVNQEKSEKRTQIVMLLTAVTMVVEIVTGLLFGSMALLADGWHMTTHVAAFGITLFAYQYARKNVDNPKYTFGTGKVSALGGFTSAVALGVIALIMALESGMRLFQSREIQFDQAIGVAIIGLVVNIISAWLLQDHHDHDHEPHHHHDHNLQAAYIHVLADALTSILAIVALCGGKFWGWIWLDAVMGLVGAAVITKWAYNLIQDSSTILLDGAVDKQTRLNVINAIEADADNRVVDLHLWHLSQDHVAAIISIVTHYPRSPEHYKTLLQEMPSLAHISVEVNPCQGEPCVPVAATHADS